MGEKIILRSEAVEKGLKRYFTGKLCKHGHISERITNSGRCCECNRLSTKKWRTISTEKGENNLYTSYKHLPEIHLLNTWLSYDYLSGKIFWKTRESSEFISDRVYKSWNTRYSGKEAGSLHYSNKYREIRLPDGKLYKAHRVAWKMFHKTEPAKIIDHVNGLGYDNRIINLREASHRDNSRNMRVVGEVTYKGVVETKEGDFTAGIHINDSRIELGRYVTAKLAASAYDEKARELFGDFANLNFPEDYEEGV